jgi:hypothetical protein
MIASQHPCTTHTDKVHRFYSLGDIHPSLCSIYQCQCGTSLDWHIQYDRSDYLMVDNPYKRPTFWNKLKKYFWSVS